MLKGIASGRIGPEFPQTHERITCTIDGKPIKGITCFELHDFPTSLETMKSPHVLEFITKVKPHIELKTHRLNTAFNIWKDIGIKVYEPPAGFLISDYAEPKRPRVTHPLLAKRITYRAIWSAMTKAERIVMRKISTGKQPINHKSRALTRLESIGLIRHCIDGLWKPTRTGNFLYNWVERNHG